CVHVSLGGDSANSFVMHDENGPEDITRIDAKKDMVIWLSSNMSFSLHLEKSAQKAFAVLRMIRRTFSRITRTDFQIIYGAYVGPLLETHEREILIERGQRAATKMVAGLKSMDYETRLAALDLFPLEYHRLRGDLIFTYALFEQGLANRFFTVDPANPRRDMVRRFLSSERTPSLGKLFSHFGFDYKRKWAKSCGQESEENSRGSAIRLGMTVSCRHCTDILRFLNSPVTVVRVAAIGQAIRISMAAESELDEEIDTDRVRPMQSHGKFPISRRTISSCHGTAYPFSDRGTLDDRYGTVHKPKHVSAMMAWHCHTQCAGTPATILFKISTATPRPIEPVVATTSKIFHPAPSLGRVLSYPMNFRSNLASLIFCHNFGLPHPQVQIRIRCSQNFFQRFSSYCHDPVGSGVANLLYLLIRYLLYLIADPLQCLMPEKKTQRREHNSYIPNKRVRECEYV
ncbi:hypothetical protein CLF_109915, partial [Clonorchis sinensis]